MKKLLYTILAIISYNETTLSSSPKTGGATNNTFVDTSNLVTISYPEIKINNQSTKQAQLTSLTINYTPTGNTTAESVTTVTKIKIPAQKGIKFTPLLKLPIQTNQTTSAQPGIIPGGVSEVQIGNDKITLTPPWTTASKEPSICIDYNGKNWILATKCTKSKYKTKKSKKATVVAPKSSTTSPKTSAKTTTAPQSATSTNPSATLQELEQSAS